jgi:hypothetical protein
MSNGYYDFPLRMSFFKITESFSHAAQRVPFIYDGYNFPSFEKIFQKNQILLVYLRGNETHLPAPDQ